jgi:hypothetical protein
VGQSNAAATSITALADAAQPAGALPANTELHIHQQPVDGPGTSNQDSSSSALGDGIKLAHAGSAGSNCSDSSDEETALLLCDRQAAAGSDSSSIGLTSASEIAACWAHANEPEQRRASLRLLMYGSLAGSVSGAMAGMTGAMNEKQQQQQVATSQAQAAVGR